ncbi:unnamed protein product [Spirodela intermedia]|uniref:non-specific serine/threonine protein kinase n=1 Tax=Spirodela intermedia TaxID=51605 RepID=A0A7I8IKA0_SPIIN|nr:unnamed protein product [Spirodela intermedia]CAA6657934.1 unnamed protein product [Spirodela intermedia]
MICFSYMFRRKRIPQGLSAPPDEEIPGIKKFRMFSYKELKNATENFSPAKKIGEGGFACVYQAKRRVGGGSEGAVDRIKTGVQGFLSELTTISNVVHKNLVILLGCCVEGNHRVLVYEYLSNNSLARSLLDGRRSGIQFNWSTRVKICIGIAQGLAFLHEEIHPHIVHRDIKASNILLDKDLSPRIADFAPEYAISGRLTRKADVYSFGVLLLEIISGRSNTNTKLSPTSQPHETWALHENNQLVNVVDPSLDGDFDDTPKLRPSMSTVVSMLTGEADVNGKMIMKPGLISDLTDLKVRSHRRDEKIQSTNTTPSFSSPQFSADTTQASNFTAFSD